ncbi:hypothetical protein E3P77_02144 [Wallemia ichthyophaga]|nr:hypothetical protein E3P77_02144 [Wallemia ichthyophaga]
MSKRSAQVINISDSEDESRGSTQDESDEIIPPKQIKPSAVPEMINGDDATNSAKESTLTSKNAPFDFLKERKKLEAERLERQAKHVKRDHSTQQQPQANTGGADKYPDGVVKQTVNYLTERNENSWSINKCFGQPNRLKLVIMSSYVRQDELMIPLFGDAKVICAQPSKLASTVNNRNWYMHNVDARGTYHAKFAITLFIQDFPPKGNTLDGSSSKQASAFETDWSWFLYKLKLNDTLSGVAAEMDDIPLPNVNALSQWDFSRSKARLVASINGEHKGVDNIKRVGHARLADLIRGAGCGVDANGDLIDARGDSAKHEWFVDLECQGSSLGAYKAHWGREFYNSASGRFNLIPGLQDDALAIKSKKKEVSKKWPPIKILFPTKKMAQENLGGPDMGGNMFMDAKKWLNADFPRDVMHRNPSKRGNIFMHAKTICGILKHTHSVTKNKMAGKLKKAEDGKEKVTFTSDEDTDSSATESEVDTTERVTEKDVAGGWVYVGSHNFTPSAWGRFTKTGSLSITNWELGVFLPLYGDDKVCNALADEYLTYKRPVEKYGENDVPWMYTNYKMNQNYVEDLPSSRLGTKEHWDDVYVREVNNFEEIGEEGEIWFGEDSVEKMVDWALDNATPEESGPSVLDMGTGNGHLLFELVGNGYDGQYLKGVDYSPASIKLSYNIAKSRGKDCEAVSFDVLDVLDQQQINRLGEWDIVMDKGTFDAICLSTGSNRLLYAKHAADLVRKGGKLLITSCNFTEDEIKSTFLNQDRFTYHSSVEHPSFSFGGSKGSTILTVEKLKAHKWRKFDIQWLIYFLIALPSFIMMSIPIPLVKWLIPVVYFGLIITPVTSQFFLPGTPILCWLMTFFCARFIPTPVRPTINVTILPTLESVWYGANISNLVTTHRHWILDICAWFPYGLVHYVVPFVIAAVAWVYAPAKGGADRNGHKPYSALQFWGFVFGVMNIIGVIVQVSFPCAPPWYELLYGLLPADYSIPGSPAGLARIDELMHSHSYSSAFGASPLVFGAFPSLHAGSATIEALFLSHFFPRFKAFYWAYVGWLYWATMYLSHHYLVDAVAGACLATACFYVLLPEHLRDPGGLPTNADIGKEKILPLSGARSAVNGHRRIWSAAADSEYALDDLPSQLGSPTDGHGHAHLNNLLPQSESRSSSISHASSAVHSRSQTPNKQPNQAARISTSDSPQEHPAEEDVLFDNDQHSPSTSSHTSRIEKHVV